MNKHDFHYELPEELIAQTPLARRDESRLLTLEKTSGKMEHRRFSDLPALLCSGDCLVLNDSRVLPARLIGERETGGGIEVVLLKDTGDGVWECLTRPGRKARPGTRLSFGDGELEAQVVSVCEGGNRLIKFISRGIFLETLERLGRMPLPPYIKSELEDAGRYQTVYSREYGSAAAPTAGLHFTRELLRRIEDRGVRVCYLTLHVGLGTFRPVKAETVEEHVMHSEYCEIPKSAAEIISRTKRDGGRVVAVGTTSCRTLESFSGDNGFVEESAGWTDCFIYPGYRFKCVDALVTNFHLPESTLIMLASALAGRENILRAYSEAIRERYRFFSFGDAMLIA